VYPAFTLEAAISIIAFKLTGYRFNPPFGFQAVKCFYGKFGVPKPCGVETAW
jgi:hypothetical protein